MKFLCFTSRLAVFTVDHIVVCHQVRKWPKASQLPKKYVISWFTYIGTEITEPLVIFSLNYPHDFT